jgi:hypothetical protein
MAAAGPGQRVGGLELRLQAQISGTGTDTRAKSARAGSKPERRALIDEAQSAGALSRRLLAQVRPGRCRRRAFKPEPEQQARA